MSDKLDLIDRAALNCKLLDVDYSENAEHNVWQLVQDMPTVDAVLVVHGRWEKEINFYFCTECDFAIHEDFIVEVKFCPSCGAKMDLKGGENNGSTD